MVKLIKLKYEKVGKKLIRLNIILHFIFTFLWTFSVAIRVPLPDEMDVESFHIKHSVEMKAILGLTLAAQPVFLLFIRKVKIFHKKLYEALKWFSFTKTLISSEIRDYF